MLKKIRKTISVMLIAVMLVSMIPVQAFAQEGVNTEQTTDVITNEEQQTQAPQENTSENPTEEVLTLEEQMDNVSVESTKEKLDKVKIVGEVVQKREENIKHFLKEDGSYEAAVYPFAVHYKENGKWKDIDNTLLDTIDEEYKKVLENKDNSYKVKISKNTNSNKLVKINKDKYEISWNLYGADKSAANVEPKDNEYLETLTENEKKKVLTNLVSLVNYENVFPNVDLQLEVQPKAVKDNIIIKEKIEDPSFAYEINLKNLGIKAQENNTLLFYDKDDESNIIFKMEAPFMYDAKGEMSTNVSVMLEEVKDGYVITVVPDKEWINSTDRVYPVVIDPKLETSPERSDIFDTYAIQAEGYADENYEEAHILKVGQLGSLGETKTFIKFNLPSLTSGDMVTNANLELYLYFAQYNDQQIDAHRITEDWNQNTLTWNNKPQYDLKIEDYCIINGAYKEKFTWNITSMVKKWYEDGENNGLALTNHEGDPEFIEFLSSDTSTDYENQRPSILLEYVNNSGLESYWTYHSQSVGRAGTGYVNDYNGNLVFIHNDLSMTGNRMPVSINHVYNSNDKDIDISYGNGWRLNLSQTVSKKPIGDTVYYKYTDSDGTIHYFPQTGSVPYEDEDGLGLELTEDTGSTTERYTIEDKKNNNLIFNSNGYLTTIKDSNNNTINLTYTNNILTSVTDGAGRQITLNVDGNGRLNSITDPAGRSITYTYTSDQLTKIEYPDTKYSEYAYDASNYLTLAKNIDGYKIDYTYTTSKPYRVKTIKESNVSGTLGEELTVDYGYNLTTFTDFEGRKTIYQFNNSGNTINIQNDEGYAQYYKFFEEGSTKNKLNSSSKLQKTIINSLLNHNIETSDYWTVVSEGNSQGSGSITTEDKYMSIQSLKINKTNTEGVTKYYQDVTLEKGKTYTLSGYIKATNILEINSKGANLAVTYKDEFDVDNTVYSEYVTGTKDWERYDVTFTLPTNATSTTCKVIASILEETGTAYFDCLQLEEGSIANRYNIVENPDITYGTDIPDFWEKLYCDSNDKVVTYSNPDSLDDSVMKINGDSNDKKYIRQIINMPGEKGDTYVFGAWAKGESVPIKDSRNFEVRMSFLRKDGTYQGVSVPFNTDSSEWQYASGVAVADSEYTQVRIYGMYYYNENSVHFDGFQIYREEFGQSYQYDSEGNLISTVDLAEQESTFNYNSSNDLIKATDAKGNNFDYNYDTNHNLLQAVTAENVRYSFEYDNYGNPLSSKVGNESSDLIAYYSFDNSNLTDDSGHGNNGVNNGAVFVDGISGKAICFDGSNDWAELTNFSVPEDFSISMWVNPHTTSGCFMGKHTSTGGNLFVTGYCPTGPNIVVRSTNQVFTSIPKETGYYHLAITVRKIEDTKTELTYYKDGVQVGQAIVNESIGDLTGKSWTLGQEWDGSSLSDFFDGEIDELAFYNHVLSPTEVSSLYDNVTINVSDYNTYIKSSATYTTNGNYINTLTDALGNSVIYNWSETKGILNNLQDGKGNTTSYVYDPQLDRLDSVSKDVTNADGSTSTITNSYAYDNDRLDTITHNGFSYNFDYDELGNNITVSVCTQNLITNDYESRTSKLLDSKYGNGQSISYTYDNLDRVTTIKYNEDYNNDQINSVERYKYEYDATGNLGYHEDLVNGISYKYVYDLANRLTKIKDSDGNSLSYDYDKNNNLSSVVENVNNSTYTTNYGFDKDNRINNISYPRNISTTNQIEQFDLDGDLKGTKGTIPFTHNAVFEKDENGELVLSAFESSTNLVSNSSFEDGTTGWYLKDWNGSTGKWRVVDDGVFGDKCLESYDSDGLLDGSSTNSVAYRVITLSSALTQNTDYTISTYAKRIGGSKPVLCVRCYDINNNQLLYVSNPKEISENEWTKISQTYAIPAGTTKIYAIVRDYVSDDNLIRYDGIQFEKKPFSTPYTESTSEETKILYDLNISKNEGTMTTWFKTNEEGTTRHVIANEANNQEILNIYIATDNKLKVSARDNAGNLYTLVSSTDIIQKDTWYFTALAWELNGSTLTAKLYLNDNVYTATTTDIKDFSNGTTALGSSINGNDQLNGQLKQFSYSPNELSDAQILDIYKSNGVTNIDYQYDTIGRLTTRTTNINEAQYATTYGYTPGINGSTSNQLQSITNNGSAISYTYDANGNIETITQNGQIISYEYNELNEVIRENNKVLDKTITYAYDVGGNITSRIEYAYTTGTLGSPTNTINYLYEDTIWKDKLTSYDGKSITYDEIGNPLTYDGYTYTWEEGRRLKTITKTGLDMSFKYNADGIRTEKTVNGVTTTYHLVGDKVTFETDGTNSIYYTYDSVGKLISMNLDGAEYYYIRNGQGDIIGLYDTTGAQVVSYVYDTWGKLISTDGTLKDTVGKLNPYRYRGYRYDSDTGLYYLQSRYYNPEICRMLNADALTGQVGELLSHNMFTYCGNNPVNMYDPSGYIPLDFDNNGNAIGILPSGDEIIVTNNNNNSPNIIDQILDNPIVDTVVDIVKASLENGSSLRLPLERFSKAGSLYEYGNIVTNSNYSWDTRYKMVRTHATVDCGLAYTTAIGGIALITLSISAVGIVSALPWIAVGSVIFFAANYLGDKIKEHYDERILEEEKYR